MRSRGKWVDKKYYGGLRKDVFKRDKHKCTRCGMLNKESKKKWKSELIIHHIDEDRTNNVMENLKTVCRNCHGKIHRNTVRKAAAARRKHWHCKVNGCINEHDAKGYCRMHYLRWHRHGNPGELEEVRPNGKSVKYGFVFNSRQEYLKRYKAITGKT